MNELVFGFESHFLATVVKRVIASCRWFVCKPCAAPGDHPKPSEPSEDLIGLREVDNNDADGRESGMRNR
jgi:hypothetical protein